jgi:hypothetical protein
LRERHFTTEQERLLARTYEARERRGVSAP